MKKILQNAGKSKAKRDEGVRLFLANRTEEKAMFFKYFCISTLH
ncbi:MAG: hypothetical protein AABY58_03745 [Nitrospirota bacterium]